MDFSTVWLFHFIATTLWIFDGWCSRVEWGQKWLWCRWGTNRGKNDPPHWGRLHFKNIISKSSSCTVTANQTDLAPCQHQESQNLWSCWVNMGLATDSHSGSETTSPEVKLGASARRNSKSCPTHFWCCFFLWSQTQKRQLAKKKGRRLSEADAVLSFSSLRLSEL